MGNDIRWQQRFDNFEAALGALSRAVATAQQHQLNELEAQGLIKAFEFTYELSWKVLKDFLEATTRNKITGSKNIFAAALDEQLIDDSTVWLNMVESRIETVHTYNKIIAKQIEQTIIQHYYPTFLNLQKKLRELL